LEERGTSEAAETCGLWHSGVRSRLQRALRQLRATLSSKLGGSLPLTLTEWETETA
jgi:DNA-directed RNA polymerase specialized sigma24 family protein